MGVGERVGEAVRVRVCEEVAVPVRDEEGVPVREEEGVPVREEEGVPVCEDEGVPVREDEGVPVCEDEGVPVREELGVELGVWVAVELGVDVWVDEQLGCGASRMARTLSLKSSGPYPHLLLSQQVTSKGPVGLITAATQPQVAQHAAMHASKSATFNTLMSLPPQSYPTS